MITTPKSQCLKAKRSISHSHYILNSDHQGGSVYPVTPGLGMTVEEGVCTSKGILRPGKTKVTSTYKQLAGTSHMCTSNFKGVKKHDPSTCPAEET